MTASRCRLLAAATIGALAISACSAGSEQSQDGDPNGNVSSDNNDNDSGDETADEVDDRTGSGAADDAITIALWAEPPTLDLATNTAAAIPQVVLYNVHETLVKVDQSGEVVPSLATEYETDESGTVYTFTLREDVTFSNGEPFTAQDVVFSIERVMSDEWTISQANVMDVVDSVEATGDHEVQVTLSRPSNGWLYAMTSRVGAIFTPTGLDNPESDPVGTGPFTVTGWDRGDAITLERNDEYWGDAPHFSDIELRYFTDASAMNNALLTGEVEVIGTLQAPESIDDFTDGDYQIIEGLTNGEIVLSMNNNRPPFDDIRARQAVRHAIDHETLVDLCWNGYGTLIGSMVPPSDPWYEDRTGDYPYDVDEAEALLEDAGLTGASVQLRLPTIAYASSCGLVVESMLEEVGFDVTVDDLEFPAAWLDDVFTNHDYDLSIIAHVEPRDLGVVFGDPDYYTGFGTDEIQDLLVRADEGTPEEYEEYMGDAAELISREAAADFLFILPNLIVAEPDITGLPQNAVSESFDLSELGRS